MKAKFLLAPLLVVAAPALAVEAPPSITSARIEVRAATKPVAAIDQAAREKRTTWVGWSVAAIPKAGDVCCFSDSFERRSCTLAKGRERSWGTTDSEGPPASHELYVLVETTGGSPSRVTIVSPSCRVDGANQSLVWLGAVEPGDSLAALARLLDAGRGEKVEDSALLAVAYHEDARADALIESRALDTSLSMERREQAIFWAGQARGEAGFRLLDRVLTSEQDPELRKRAVFAMSQSKVPQAPERIKRVAVEDKDVEVRAHAYFSLSQTNAPGAGAWIVDRLDAERDEDVRDQAIFALSQLKDGTDWLLKVLRTKRDPETLRRTLFWLGQSRDPRALDAIARLLGE